MATLLLTAVGTVLGGPLGGALGALVGRQVDGAIIGGRSSEGPRLKELSVQTSSYGAPLPLHFGRMRAAGTVIWSTELIERRERQGGGKGRPSVTTYSYSASFAVALSSRPIRGIGRVWADGNLLRGAAGDLKTGGAMRVYTGYGDQPADPLLAQAEGVTRCPAFRNTAYVVFEDLELADFGNRLPSLTFEILADEGDTSVAAIVAGIVPDASRAGLGQGLAGFSIDRGSIADTLESLSAALPLACSAWGETISIRAAEMAAPALVPLLPVPARSRDDSEAAHQTGSSQRRAALPRTRVCGVRYYDVDRDFQPGVQRGRGRTGSGELAIIDLPAAIPATSAQRLADAVSRRSTVATETARYRIASLDARFGPGCVVAMPDRPGAWRVDQWEWQDDGVSLQLTRLPSAAFAAARDSDPGRANTAIDLVNGATVLAAFELPWDGSGNAETPAVFVAASSPSPGWTGAALFSSQPGGVLTPIGSTGRRRAIMGQAVTALPTANPLVFDRANTVEVRLVATDLTLPAADYGQIVAGANRALLGGEIIQFATAEPLGAGRWRLAGLLRGRGGTEDRLVGHAAGEPFVLLDDRILPLDQTALGDAATAQVVATGLGDSVPVTTTVTDSGVTRQPLMPVHGRVVRTAGGMVSLTWIRRARGEWLWLDQVDTPLNEQAESWEITLRDGADVVLQWLSASTTFAFDAGLLAGTTAAARLEVRQVGNAGRSRPMVLTIPPIA